VNSSNNAKQEIAAADYPNIRLFQVGRVIAQEPQEDVPATWSECSPETVQDFSAVAYCFGRELYKKLGVPIGLLHTSWGGTGSESWTSADMMAANNAFKPILKKLEDSRAGYDAKYAEFEKNLAEYREKARKMRAAGEDPGREPRAPYGPIHQHAPSRLFNGMVAPLIPYAFQGAIWYQGEHNASRAYQYREIFPAMIQDWRNHWIRGDFPFLFVQLANFRERKTEPVEEDWAELREAQLMTLKMKNTGQAVIIDIGEADNIHPTNKQDVGHRLAVAARAQVYGEKIEYSGPMYEASRIVGKKVYLQFSHQGSGMTTKGDVALKGFAIAGADKKFVWADAEIVGGEIMVSSAMVPKPVAVRYGWANNPECNLYNREGLPASPFRTDTWKGITADNK